MAYIKLDASGVVVYKTPYDEAGAILVPDDVVCGMIKSGTTFINQTAPAPTTAQIKSVLEQAVQAHLDTGAKLAGYDSILSACSYAGAPNAFQAEGISFINWRAAVWVYCNAVVASVLAGTAAVPTASGLIAGLPERVA